MISTRHTGIQRTLLMVAMLPGLAAAAPSPVETTIHITGVSVAPPCEVNGGGSIEVNFGNVPVSTMVDNGPDTTYQQVMTVPVKCSYYTGSPYVRFSGTQLSGAPTNVLVGGLTNVGVALYQGSGTGTPLELGNGVSDSSSGFIGHQIMTGLDTVNTEKGNFTFTAALYKRGADVLQTGGVSASGTMSISYQ